VTHAGTGGPHVPGISRSQTRDHSCACDNFSAASWAAPGIKVRIARRGIGDKTKLGCHRWVVERTASWLLGFKRPGLRYDRTQLTLRRLLTLSGVLINLRRLVRQES